MATWPVSLPQAPLLAGFQFAPQPNVIAFGTEVGPGKTRRRSTARVRTMPFSMHVTDAQLEDFTDFFETDLSDGALAFDLTDPVTGLTGSFQFDPASPWSASAIGPDLWLVSAQLRKIP